jgi:hypothetical protein
LAPSAREYALSKAAMELPLRALKTPAELMES